MPLDSASLNAATKFSFVRPVTGWADLEQGNNEIGFGGTIDTAVWNQAYAAIIPLTGGTDETIDLTSFTNLAGEAVALSAVIGITVTVAPVAPADTDIEVQIGPGVSNGLEWLAGANPVTLASGDAFSRLGTGPGTAVDATHKTLLVENVGTDDATVTIVIFGKI